MATTAAVGGFAIMPRASSGASLLVTHTGDSGAGSLRDAIAQANAAGAGNHTITLNLTPSDTITLTDELERIEVNIAINGNGATLDANNQHRLFFIAGGNVSISNFTLKSALAKGGDGAGAELAGGGGGGLGAGGAIYVDNGATVSVDHVIFQQNTAQGGDGGGVTAIGTNAGGGGGGGLHGNGGHGGYDGGGGGGGFLGNGGNGGGGVAGGGGGGLLLDGGDAIGPLPGLGALTGGDGGSLHQDGGDGLATGGGGGGGDGGDGGAGGEYGGGGGGGYMGTGGTAGFGGGGGGAGFAGNEGAAGFGGGEGGATYVGGGGGDGLGGAIFVRAGGSLTVTDSTFVNNSVVQGNGGLSPVVNGGDGAAAGSGIYLMLGTTVNFAVSTSGQITMADDIAGLGTVRKIGGGELILTGANNYTGGTFVDAGRLAVNGSQTTNVNVASGGELGGNGTITGDIINGGTLAAGNSIGTLNVIGNYMQNGGSTTEVEIDDQGHSDRLNVTGNVTINGGTVNVVSAPGNYIAGQSYTFITYTGGLYGTGFSGITDDLAFFDAVLSYDPHAIGFYLQPNGTAFEAIADTINEKIVARIIDHDPYGPLHPLVDEMLLMTNGQVRGSLNQLGGAVYGTNVQTQLQNTTAQMQLLAQHLRPAAGGDTFTGVAAARQPTSTDSMIAFDSSGDLVIRGQSECLPRYTTWGTGYGLGGNAQSDGNAAGLDYALGGVQAGIDRWLDEGTLAGVYGGYNYAQLDGNGLAQRVQANSGQFGGYFRRDLGCDYYVVASGLSFDSYDASRWLSIGAINSSASANYDGWQSATYVERGRTYELGGGTVQPYAALQYIYLRQNSFSETGAAPANLDVAGIDAHSLRSVLGARASREVVTARGRVFVPQVRAGWLHEFLETDTLVTNRFGSLGGSSFAVQGLDLGRDWAIGGAGLGWRLTDQLTLTGNYDLQANANQAFHVGSANVQYVW